MIAAGVWLSLLSFAVMLCVSQLTVLTKRFELALGPPVTASGPEIGMSVPAEVEDLLTYEPDGEIIMLMSATCGPCRQVAEDLTRDGFEGALTILLPGSDDAAAEVTALLPTSLAVIRDPDAGRFASALAITHTPFALALYGRTVVGKSPVNRVDDLQRLRDAIAQMDRDSLPPLVELGGSR